MIPADTTTLGFLRLARTVAAVAPGRVAIVGGALLLPATMGISLENGSL
jgi:hypothetical protein